MRRSHTIFCAIITLTTLGPIACSTTRWEKRTETVRIVTSPPGATVWYQDKSGQHQVGQAPAELQHEYEVGIYEHDNWTWLWAALSVGGLAGGSTWAVYAPEKDDTQQGIAIALAVVAGLATLATLPLAIAGPLKDGEEESTRTQIIDVGASKEGYESSRMTLEIPTDREELSLLLHPTHAAEQPQVAVLGSLTGASLETYKQAPVVAVFDIHDASGRFDKASLDQLTSYLVTSLAQEKKARVVPREQIRKRLREKKEDSYRTCYEEGCQIELGRALAAEKSLSTTLLRVGKKCALTANLFDLKSETAERGASAETDCDLDALMGAVRQVVEKL